MCAGLCQREYYNLSPHTRDVLCRSDFQRALKNLTLQTQKRNFPPIHDQTSVGGSSCGWTKKESPAKISQQFPKNDSVIPECSKRGKTFDEDSKVINSIEKYKVFIRRGSGQSNTFTYSIRSNEGTGQPNTFTYSIRSTEVNSDFNRLNIRKWITKQLTRRDEKQDSQADDESFKLLNEEESHFNFNCRNNIHHLVSNMITKEIPYFIWTVRRSVIDCRYLHSDQMINHYGKDAAFTTKASLCRNLRNLPSYLDENADTFFPRCYLVSDEKEERRLCNDFRLTSAICILKWVIYNSVSVLSSPNSGPGKIKKDYTEETKVAFMTESEKHRKTVGQLPATLIGTAIRVCEDFLQSLEQAENHMEVDTTPTLSNMEWADLVKQHYDLVHNQATIPDSHNYVIVCQDVLNRLKSVHPQLEIDGFRNIWIVKPAAKSRGRDIKCVDRLDEFQKLKDFDLPLGNPKWVVQKYIEKPLLIYDTKFDIRLWFLVTDWNPINIWFYKDCYLRFSTQPFTLENLDSSVHLCNNAIQKQFKPSAKRNPLVPKESMWSSRQFQDYLKLKGHSSVWQELVYPSMKKAIICSLVTVQAIVQAHKNNFGLYGADFLLGEDFKPWLIEINLSPSMSPSTSVTALLCPKVQEDTIKVIIDRKQNSKCNIGQFEGMSKQVRISCLCRNMCLCTLD